jgi:YD repeat-containing protein
MRTSIDRANRLKLADYQNYYGAQSNALDVRNIKYDNNGNFEELRRHSNSTQSDFLQYVYYDGTNRLRNTTNNTSDTYTYDRLGNMASNTSPNRNIQSIGYDGRNLPFRMLQTNSGNTQSMLHQYSYDTYGNRVSKTYDSPSVSSGYHYIRDANGKVMAVYSRQGSLLFWNIPGGQGRIFRK